MKAPKRLGIFVTYDAEGIIDDYIPYLLEDMRQNLAHLVVVCNGFVNEEGLQKLRRFTDDVFVRENKEYDAGAIKDVLYNLYGWEKVYEFDELVLFNDSFFGPFYPFKVIFDEMDGRKIDFWGLSEQCEYSKEYPEEDENFPYHLQSFFITIKESLLKTEDYKVFWETMPPINTFIDAVKLYEIRMKPYFVKIGYKGESFTVFSPLISAGSNDNPLFTYDTPYEIIRECSYPILKRKALIRENYYILKSTGAEGYASIIHYIDNQTGYDVNLIWDHVLRVYDISDLRYTMHLDKVLPSKISAYKNKGGKKIAIIVNASHCALRDKANEYLKCIPMRAGIDIISGGSYGYNNIIEDYDYFCLIQDIAFKNTSPVSVFHSAIFTALENTIKSLAYIENIINEFNENPRLGLLTPPNPLHASYFSSFGGDWAEDIQEARSFAKSVRIDKLSPLKRPFMSESAFWCRTKALERLRDRDIFRGFNAPEMKTLPYVAQKAGYYSAVVMSDSYAALQTTNCEYMLAEIIGRQKEFQDSTPIEFGFNEFITRHVYSKMAEFCAGYDKIYIYGAGDLACRCAKFFTRSNIAFEGFVVSDGGSKSDELFNHKVQYFSELEPPDERTAIILGMRRDNTAQVFPVLWEKGYKNLFTAVPE